MTRHGRVQHQRLMSLESEFQRLLATCLPECARGRWGLFRPNDHIAERRYFPWPEAEHARALAREIRSIRTDLGETSNLCERFLELCVLRGSNVRGEPRLAKALLREIDLGSYASGMPALSDLDQDHEEPE